MQGGHGEAGHGGQSGQSGQGRDRTYGQSAQGAWAKSGESEKDRPSVKCIPQRRMKFVKYGTDLVGVRD